MHHFKIDEPWIHWCSVKCSCIPWLFLIRQYLIYRIYFNYFAIILLLKQKIIGISFRLSFVVNFIFSFVSLLLHHRYLEGFWIFFSCFLIKHETNLQITRTSFSVLAANMFLLGVTFVYIWLSLFIFCVKTKSFNGTSSNSNLILFNRIMLGKGGIFIF